MPRTTTLPRQGSYELVDNSSINNSSTDFMQDNSSSFTEEMHYRSSILAASHALNLPDDTVPTAQEGMLRRVESLAADTSIEHVMDGDATCTRSTGSSDAKVESPMWWYQNNSKTTSTKQQRSEIYQKAERDVIRRTLEEIDKVANKRIRDGFSEVNFTLGVLNMILVVFVFALYPQHFWLLFLIEGVVFVASKAHTFWTAKPLNNILYLLDYCWVMNILALFVLVFFLFDGLVVNPSPSGNALHKQVFMASIGTACGPLLGACLILPFVAVLFHDINTLSDLFIHIFPPMVAYTLKWEADDIRQAWPNVFILDYTEEVTFFPNATASSSFFNCVVGSTITLYLVWFVLFTGWMLTTGINLPRSDLAIVPKYDTVFHSLMRGGLYIVTGTTFFGRSKTISVEHMNANHFEKGDLFVYLVAHAVLAISSTFILGYPCFHSKRIHSSLLMLVTVVTVYRGARRYTYYATEMYGKTLRKQFAHLLDEDVNS